ncbi:MAG TPA: glycosyltransferase family protein [Conexivisphaerales archaeon]|nr:glycosyltransferase family protein [Conexivisphaerales archaeon]
MRMLFGVCAWGLGHATRTLPIIRKTVEEGHDVTVVSSGRALTMLKQELGGGVTFAHLEDYLPPNIPNSSFLALATLMRFPVYVTAMFHEHDYVRRFLMERHFDVIFSDNRFGFYSRDVPSFFMGHQLRILNPLGSRILEDGTEVYNKYFLDRYAGVLVPDFEEDGLAGRLAHDLSIFDESKINYVGVLSEFARRPSPEDIDVFVSISGPEPMRTSFERLVRSQLKGYGGKVVVSLGKPEDNGHERPYLRSYMSRNEREELLNRSKIVVARSGYSTLMDLSVLKKRGFLVPTTGQLEQEYLARHHMQRQTFYSVSERDLDFQRQLDDALSFKAPPLMHSTEKAVAKAVDVITQTGRSG